MSGAGGAPPRRTPGRAWIEDPPQPPPARVAAGRIAVTFIGHASFLLQIGGRCLLLDPVWSPRASPLRFAGPKRVRAPGQPLDGAARRATCCWSATTTTTIWTCRPCARCAGAGRRPRSPASAMPGTWPRPASSGAPELDWWQSTEVAGLRITYVPAQHFSARTPFDRNRSLWGGFVIAGRRGHGLFRRRQRLVPAFRRDRPAPSRRIDLALLPIGAYEPRWFMRTQHMDPGEAVRPTRPLAPGAASACISAPSPA